MNIIPAIDLKKGKVVKAIQGDRASYEPIDLVTTYSSNPITFIKALMIRYKPSTIYLADLDLLEGDGNNIDIIYKIANMFRNKIFWVDVGAKKIKNDFSNDELTSYSTETFDDDIFNHLNIDQIEKCVNNFDDLFIYYLDKYNIEYIYFCYINRNIFNKKIYIILQ